MVSCRFWGLGSDEVLTNVVAGKFPLIRDLDTRIDGSVAKLGDYRVEQAVEKLANFGAAGGK